MSIGQDLPAPGSHLSMLPRHPPYGRHPSSWSHHQPPQKQTAYMLPMAPLQPYQWFGYDHTAMYRPLFPPSAAYHTPPMQQAPFYAAAPTSRPPPAQFNAAPYFFATPPPLPQPCSAPALHPVVSACRDTHEYKSIAEAYMDDPSSACLRNLKLIPASASVIPAHPSIDDSAVPLAGIGADFVWEVVHDALARGAPRSGSTTPPGLAYGTIGAERSLAKQQAHLTPVIASLAQYSLSGGSKALIGPLTPPSSSMSSACPIPPQFQSEKFTSIHAEVPPWSESYWEANRSPETSPTVAGSRAEKPDPYSAFAAFCDNVLNVTLVTPQTLLLALHYVCQACRDGASDIYRQFSTRSAPYKLFIGALVMANKVLDDNSYKSQTWAQVSAVPLKDVNASEAFVFDALRFDVSMSAREWSDFLYGLAASYQRSRLTDLSTLRRLTQLAAFRLP